MNRLVLGSILKNIYLIIYRKHDKLRRLKKRGSYDEVDNFIQKDKTKIKYPNRDATRLLNTPQYSSLLELDDLDEQEEEIKKAQLALAIGATQLTRHLATPPSAPTPIQIMHASSGRGVSTSIAPAQQATIAPTQQATIAPTQPAAAAQAIPRPQPSILDLLRGPRRRQQEPATPQQQQAASQQQTLADIFALQRNAQNYARQHPANPTSAALAIDDADDYDDPEDDDDYGDAISMYGDSVSHAIAQQQQTEEDRL